MEIRNAPMNSPPITQASKRGRVFFVGAGPGDPKLLTLRGAECLRRADVVIYDALVNERILDHARPDARRIRLGAGGQAPEMRQAEVCRRLVELAQQGLTVVRLKGGDPMVFARIADESARLADHGIAFELVPGITAALAAASYAGIAITQRGCAPAVGLVSAHTEPGDVATDAGETPLDHHALARFPGTLAYYMGTATAAVWTARLVRAGKPPDTPATIVHRCTFPDQVCVRCRLDEVAGRLDAADPASPAIVVVGPAAGLPPALAWFEQRPLFGQRVLVARPIDQAAAWADSLTELGAEVLIQPAIRIEDPPDWRPVDDALDRLADYDWLVFSSSNGVRFLLRRLFARGFDLRRLGRVRLAAVGPATADALAEYHLRTDVTPDEFRAESLASALAVGAAGQRFLSIRASRGREVLADQLRSAGAVVDQIVAYSSIDVAVADAPVKRRLAAGEIHWATVTSSAIARSLAALFGEDLRKVRLASISPITSATLRALGYEPAVEARAYTTTGLLEAILEVAAGPVSRPSLDGSLPPLPTHGPSD